MVATKVGETTGTGPKPRQRGALDPPEVVLRTMTPGDAGLWRDFIRGITIEEHIFLEEEVTSFKAVIAQSHQGDLAHSSHLLALVNGRIVACARLRRTSRDILCRAGEIRVLVDPGYQSYGLDKPLIKMLAEGAWQDGAESLYLLAVTGLHQAVVDAATSVGFVPVGMIHGHRVDPDGVPRDMLLMRLYGDRAFSGTR